jgi:hypothetical protein
MKIVIDIPEEAYNLLNNEGVDWLGAEHILNAVANGTPVPKGHGKIGDLDAVMSDICASINGMTNAGIMVDGEYLWGKLNDAIDNAQPIIEADNKNKAEKEPDTEPDLEV